MPIRVICPSCRRVGKAPDQAIGRTARCPACKNTYTLTAEHVQVDPLPLPDDDEEVTPTPRVRSETVRIPAMASRLNPQAEETDEAYGLDPEAIKPPTPVAPRLPAAPVPPASRKPVSKGGSALPVPLLVGGAVGIVVVSVVVTLAVVLSRGRQPAGAVEEPAIAATIGAPASAPSNPAPAEPAVEVSVAAMLSLDDGSQAPAEANPAGESDVAANARAGAAALASRDDDAGKPISTADIVEESEPSVALIKGKGSSGTGFLVGPGLLATNAHVVDDEFASDLEVRFVSADEAHNSPIHAELLYEDPERDLAFLAVKTDLKPLRVAKSYAFKKGEDITVIGNPGMGDGSVLENAISRGIMSTKAKVDNKNFYQLNIAINPGNSGGPVFDSTGRVIGVATLKSMKAEATGYSIPIEDLQAAIAKVGSQTTAEAEQYRSKHRSKMAVKALGGGGALLCLLIDVRKANAQVNSPEINEVRQRLETVADTIEKDLLPTLAVETPLARNDKLIETPTRNLIGEISDNFTKLRTATANPKPIDDRQFRVLKQNHRRLVVALSESLKIEFPKDMMVAFDDHAPTQGNVVTIAPSNLGSYSSRLRPKTPTQNPPGLSRGSTGNSRLPSARDRLQQKRKIGR